MKNGGLDTVVMEWLNDHDKNYVRVHRIGVPDCFINQGTVPELRKLCAMDNESIKRLIDDVLNKKGEDNRI